MIILGWFVIAVLGFNVLFFGTLFLIRTLEDWRDKKHEHGYNGRFDDQQLEEGRDQKTGTGG